MDRAGDCEVLEGLNGSLVRRDSAIGELEFLTKLQRILSEGQFVASYKYAPLLRWEARALNQALRSRCTVLLIPRQTGMRRPPGHPAQNER